MLDEQLTTCLDLDTGALVQIPDCVNDADLEVIRRRSYRGIRRLVCALCREGVDAAAGTEVPLLLREPTGGHRAHFAHPAGRAPHTGQHSVEMMRQLGIRADLQQWALRQPGVATARGASQHRERERGQQIVIEFSGGQVVVLRVQAEPLTQGQWLAERAAYADAWVVDEWLWAVGAEGGWLGPSAARWEINESGNTALVAAIGSAGGGVRRYPAALRDLTLTIDGLQGPCVALRDQPATTPEPGPTEWSKTDVERSQGALGGPAGSSSDAAADVEYQGMPVVDLDAVLGHEAAVEIEGGAGMETGRAAQLVYKTLGLYEECAVEPLAAEFGDRCPHTLGVLARHGYLELLERGGVPKARRTNLGRRRGRVMTEPHAHRR